MLALGNKIRLVCSDLERLKVATGVEPGKLETVEDYNGFLDNQIARFNSGSPEDQAVRFMIERLKIRQP